MEKQMCSVYYSRIISCWNNNYLSQGQKYILSSHRLGLNQNEVPTKILNGFSYVFHGQGNFCLRNKLMVVKYL